MIKLSEDHTVVMLSVIVTLVGFVFFRYGIHHDEQCIMDKCREARQVLEDNGNDMSSFSCGEPYTAKERCHNAIKTMQSLGKDVSGIKCASTS